MSNGNHKRTTSTSIGVGAGSVIAGLISWEHTHRLGWTILHVIAGWVYVIYSWAIGRIHW